MLDLLFLLEWMWCSLSLSTRGAQLAALYSGGLIASSYTAAHLSVWMTRTFTPTSSRAFLWLADHISTRKAVIVALAGFTPATTAATGGQPLHQAIAIHMLHTLFYLVMTFTVFGLFIMMWHLSHALWDREVAPTVRRTGLATALSIACGAYLTFLTGDVIASVAWLRQLPFLARATSHSLGMAGVEAAMHFFHVI